MKVSIVITAYNEPETIKKAIEAILPQIDKNAEFIVSAPDKATQETVKKYKKVKLVKDEGKGKSQALNLIFKQLKGDIWIFTDGDVYVGENAIKEITKQFEDKTVGCVTGRPVSLNSKKTMVGYWSHLLYDAGAHRIRKKLNKEQKFLECSGYLFAFRNNITRNIPLNVAEDTMIPYLVTKKGYKVRYAEQAVVYVKNPTTVRDFIKQRIRTAKAHETLEEYAPFFPRVKSFRNEIRHGTIAALNYAKNIKEFFWTLILFGVRLYIWFRVKLDHWVLKKRYGDAWERIESTK